ncbi:MAG TPA: type II toxin-antitoxin system RelE/ParE family toxin [Thermoanaerobaculia bacterium]
MLMKIRELAGDPLAGAKKLTDPRIGSFRWRIGDYRAIFDVERETVVVLRVGDRKDIYS